MIPILHVNKRLILLALGAFGFKYLADFLSFHHVWATNDIETTKPRGEEAVKEDAAMGFCPDCRFKPQSAIVGTFTCLERAKYIKQKYGGLYIDAVMEIMKDDPEHCGVKDGIGSLRAFLASNAKEEPETERKEDSETVGQAIGLSKPSHHGKRGSKIPKTIHFVYVSHGIPEKQGAIPTSINETVSHWKSLHPQWRVRLWDNAAVRKEFADLVPTLARIPQMSWVANLLRYHILEREGGVYLDTDIRGLKSLDPLLDQMEHSAFTVCQDPFEKNSDFPLRDASRDIVMNASDCVLSCNAVIGAVPHHTALQQTILHSMANTHKALQKQGEKYDLHISGPFQWHSDAVRQDVAFLRAFTFYPCSWLDPAACSVADNFKHDDRVFAMHMWSMSWLDPKKRDAIVQKREKQSSARNRREEPQPKESAVVSRKLGKGNSGTATLCLIVKDPHKKYIDEWADYHFGIGFNELHVFDNSQNFSLRDWGMDKPYSNHIHKVHFLPGETHNVSMNHEAKTHVQNYAYMECVNRAKSRNVSWVATFDVDEFLVLHRHNNVQALVNEYCPDDSKCAQLSLNWVLCGSTEPRQNYVPVPVTRRFQHCGELAESWVKPLVRPATIDSRHSWLHTFHLLPGNEWWDTNGRQMPMSKRWNFMHNHDGPNDIAVLFHYAAKSEEEFRYKNCERGDVNNFSLSCNATRPKLPKSVRWTNQTWQTLIRVAPGYKAAFANATVMG